MAVEARLLEALKRLLVVAQADVAEAAPGDSVELIAEIARAEKVIVKAMANSEIAGKLDNEMKEELPELTPLADAKNGDIDKPATKEKQTVEEYARSRPDYVVFRGRLAKLEHGHWMELRDPDRINGGFWCHACTDEDRCGHYIGLDDLPT